MPPRPRISIVAPLGSFPDLAEAVKTINPNATIAEVDSTLVTIHGAMPGTHALIAGSRWAKPLVPQADATGPRGQVPWFTADILEAAGETLEWIHVGGAGCEEYLIPELVHSNVVVTNGKIIQGPEVADHALALLLTLTRSLHFVLRGQTGPDMPRPIELLRKTAVVIGLGGVGTLIAERARAFGMRVIGVDPEYVPMVSTLDDVVTPESLMTVLPTADVVFMAGPSTPTSAQMMGKEAFRAMKPSAYFINVSRGATTDTDALTSALQDGEILGAGLDVTEPEPLPPDHPLRHMDNVVVSPHIAGLSEANRQRSFDLIEANVVRYLQGRPLFNIVDKKRGY